MGKDRFSIKLDAPTDSYYTGGTITGYLKMNLAGPMTVKKITAQWTGESYVEFTIGAGEQAITYTATENYCLDKLVLLDKGSTELSQGEHKFPFTFTVPKDAPTSFESFQANIRYNVGITVERALLKFDKVFMRIVNVINPLDLNEIKTENLMDPSESAGEKMVCCLCCKSGPITATLKTDRKGYVPGDTIIVNGEVTNLSGRPIKHTKCRLKMFVTLRAGNMTTAYCNELGTVKQGSIDPGDTGVIRNAVLKIPPVPPSVLLGCNIIETLYVVELSVVPTGPSLNLSLLSTIIIGSIPLAEVASRHGVTVPSAPTLSSVPTELYSETHSEAPPQASFAESVFGDVHMGKGKEKEKDEEVEENVPFVPKYLYYNWEQHDPVKIFSVTK